MKRVYEIPDPIYNFPLTIYLGTYPQMQAYCERRWGMNRPAMEPNRTAERFFVVSDGVVLASVLWFPQWDCLAGDYSSLVHECMHHVLWVFDLVGIDISVNNQEPAAYYLSYIYEQAFKALCDEWKKCKKRG